MNLLEVLTYLIPELWMLLHSRARLSFFFWIAIIIFLFDKATFGSVRGQLKNLFDASSCLRFTAFMRMSSTIASTTLFEVVDRDRHLSPAQTLLSTHMYWSHLSPLSQFNHTQNLTHVNNSRFESQKMSQNKAHTCILVI